MKKMMFKAEDKIGEIVSRDYRTAQVFKNHDLDFCCGGGKTLKEACERRSIALDSLQRELTAVCEEPGEEDNYAEWNPGFLIDYIVNNHHNYVQGKLPEIRAYAAKVAKVHGERHPETVAIYREFEKLMPELLSHLNDEEQVLFPYVKKLEQAAQSGEEAEKPDFKSASNPIRSMIEEHEEAGDAMERIRELSNDFSPPEDACTTYRVLYQNLKAFRDDLHKHVHLENNILFPKAIALEKRMN